MWVNTVNILCVNNVSRPQCCSIVDNNGTYNRLIQKYRLINGICLQKNIINFNLSFKLKFILIKVSKHKKKCYLINYNFLVRLKQFYLNHFQ